MSPSPPHVRRIWHYGRAKEDSIIKSITDYNWETALEHLAHDPDKQVEHFDEVLLNVAKKCIPFDDKTINPKDPPWITKSSKNLYVNYKRKYKKFAKKNSMKSNTLTT